MAAMTAPPYVDSVQSSTPTAWRAARGRSARGFGQKPTEFESALRSARERHAAARPSHTGAAAPAHGSQPRGPRKTAHTHQHTRWRTRRDSENQNHGRMPAAAAPARSHAAAGPRAARPQAHYEKDRTHTPNTRPRLRIPTKPPPAGPPRSNGTSPASPRTTTTSTSSSATARRRSSATTRSRAASRSSATAWTASTSSRTCVLGVPSCRGAIDATRLHLTIKWVVYFFILRRFGPSREASRTRVAGPHPEGHPGRLRRRHDARARRARGPDGGLHGDAAPGLFPVGREDLGADSASVSEVF